MRIVEVKLSEEVESFLEQIFFGCDLERHLHCHGDECLLYLLEHLAHARSGKSSGRIYSNLKEPTDEFRKELEMLVQRVAISTRNIIAHRLAPLLSPNPMPPIEVD